MHLDHKSILDWPNKHLLSKGNSWLAASLPLWIVAAGILLRLRQYLYDRSLWLDELMLSSNIIERDYAGLLQPLDSQQMAPVGFLMAQKVSTVLIGNHEWGLRFFPFLCGVLAIVALYLWLRDEQERFALWMPLALFGLSFQLIYYAAEAKQYGTDVCCAVLAFAVYMPLARHKLSWGQALAYTLPGAIMIWFSHTVVFVLLGIGVYLCLVAWQHADWRQLLAYCLVGVGWLASFGTSYSLILASDEANSQLMKTYWQHSFAPLLPTSLAQIEWYFQSIDELFAYTVGIKHLGWLLLFVMLCGVIGAWQRRDLWLIPILLPIPLLYLVSALQLYPFTGRFLTFLAPSVAIGLAYGLHVFGQQFSLAIYMRLLVGLLLFQPILLAIFHLAKPIEKEEVKQVLTTYSRQYQQGDAIYVFHRAKRAFDFYQPHYVQNGRLVIFGIVAEGPDDAYMEELERISSEHQRVWFLFSHDFFDEGPYIRQQIATLGGEIRQEHYAKGASIHLVQFSKSPSY